MEYKMPEIKEPNRFDYVAYDAKACADQAHFKDLFMGLEKCVEDRIRSPRAKALVLTYLEITYMWIGKAIRDDQIERAA